MNTLHIIGNGFDLYHGLPTKYIDFYHYIKGSKDCNFIEKLERYFGDYKKTNNSKKGESNNILWSEFEKGLGIYNADLIMYDIFDGHAFDIDHPSRSVGEVEAELDFNVNPIKEKLKYFFSDWIKSIDTKSVKIKELPFFDNDGLFINFNYTNILETEYNIESDKICYIHGRAKNPSSEIIFGHNNKFTDFKKYEPDFYDREAYQIQIAEFINGLYKDTNAIIRTYKNFFDMLKDRDRVVIYGHSLGEVDKQYFAEIVNNVTSNASWFISYHEEFEKDERKKFFINLGVNNANIKLFEM